MKYVFGKMKPGAYACRLDALKNVEDDFELFKGISRLSTWPDDAFFPMDESFREEKQLEDFIDNTNGVLVVSNKVKELLSELQLNNNEWLPVQIKDHKGRMVKEKYYILHQLQLQNCIDLENSETIKNSINPDIFTVVMKLVIDESLIDSDLDLFRMTRYPYLPIFDKKVVTKIVDAQLSGILFDEIDAWDGV